LTQSTAYNYQVTAVSSLGASSSLSLVQSTSTRAAWLLDGKGGFLTDDNGKPLGAN
jgi:hypothetical protein